MDPIVPAKHVKFLEPRRQRSKSLAGFSEERGRSGAVIAEVDIDNRGINPGN